MEQNGTNSLKSDSVSYIKSDLHKRANCSKTKSKAARGKNRQSQPHIKKLSTKNKEDRKLYSKK